MPVIAGVLCYQLRDNFAEGIAAGEGPNASTSFLVPDWYDRYTVANALLGMSSYTVSGGVLRITSPGTWADSVNLHASQVSIRGVGQHYAGPKQIAFTSAIVSASYGVPKYDMPGSDAGGAHSLDPTAPLIFATQSIKFGGSWITIPQSKLKTIGGSSIEQGFGRFVGVNTLSVTLHQFPFLVTKAMRLLIGRINVAPFFGCDTGTLMLHGISTNRTAAVDGTVNQETTYEFSERPEAPWDETYTGQFTASGWEQVFTQAGANVILRGDFAQLIPAFYRGA